MNGKRVRDARVLRVPVAARIGSTVSQQVAVVLAYVPADPFAVGLAIPQLLPDGGARLVSWVFARELLTEGCLRETRTGGDVTISPVTGSQGEHGVRIELSSPDGHATVWLRAEQVELFLAESYRRVPAGSEVERINWAREIAANIAPAGGAC